MEILEKPWGEERLFALTAQYAGKLLHINKGARLSLQKHQVKDETLYILSGMVKLTVNGIDFMAGKDCQSIRIKAGEIHRIEAIIDSTIIEVSTPELDDVVRIEDDYGRVDVNI